MTRDHANKQKALKEIIRELHAGTPVEKLQKKFAGLIRDTSPQEIADMENALIEEGFPVAEVQRLCDVHARVFEKSLKRAGKPGKIPGHPVHTYRLENREAKKRIKQLARLLKQDSRLSESGAARVRELFRQFKDIELHYARKENQLFPYLEKKGFTGPSKVMWGKHDEIRNMIREMETALGSDDWSQAHKLFRELASAVKRLIFLEEKILFPTAMKKLDRGDWAAIGAEEPEIGYSWVKPAATWDPALEKGADGKSAAAALDYGVQGDGSKIPLQEGGMTPGQLKRMLVRLPLDLTFVDRHDRVRFYSANPDRIFPRSPAVIGRRVQDCHPPKSIDVVNRILEAFRNKEKEQAGFWITMNDRFIHIRYFPIYDDEGAYDGVIEVTQDVTEIRNLEGERRLPDWS